MNQQGIGAMIHYLSGGNKNDPKKYYGKKIVKAELKSGDPDSLDIEFKDGVIISILDNGQSCCESRYMTCDDNVESLVGGKLKRIEVKNVEDKENEYGRYHEIAFLEIATNKTSITIATHNEHNGYYGGFGLTIGEL